MKGFYDKGRVSGLLKDVPVYAVLVEDIGLRGAHFVAMRVRAEDRTRGGGGCMVVWVTGAFGMYRVGDVGKCLPPLDLTLSFGVTRSQSVRKIAVLGLRGVPGVVREGALDATVL